MFINGEQIFNGENNDRAHFWFDLWTDDDSKPGCNAYGNSMLADSFVFQNRKIIYSGCNMNGDLKYFDETKIGDFYYRKTYLIFCIQPEVREKLLKI